MPRAPQQFHDPIALLRRQAGERLGAHLATDRDHLDEERLRFLGDEKLPGAAVPRIGATLDPAGLCHPVEERAQRDRLELQKLGEPRLVDALVIDEIGQDLALRAGQAQAFGALIEALAEHPRGLVQDEAEAAIEVEIAVAHRYYNNKQA